MATFRRRGTKWQAQVRLRGHPAMSRTFTLKNDAEVWARRIEASIERSDFPDAGRSLNGIKLRQLLERYEETITPLKKSRAPEKYLLRTIRSHPIASLCLDKLTPCQRRRVIAAVGRRESAAGMQAKRPPISGAFLLVAVFSRRRRLVVAGLRRQARPLPGVTGACFERADNCPHSSQGYARDA